MHSPGNRMPGIFGLHWCSAADNTDRSNAGKVPTVGPVFNKYVYLPVALNVSEATATTSRASGDADNMLVSFELIPILIELVDSNNSSHPDQA